MGGLQQDIINGSNDRLSLIESDNKYKLSWNTSRRNGTTFDKMIGDGENTSTISVIITYV